MEDKFSTNDNKLYKYFRVEYRLNQKIPFSEISQDIPNIEFIIKDHYLQGFIITINKILKGSAGEKQITKESSILASLLSIFSHRHISLEIVDKQFIECEGISSVCNDLTIIYNIEGAPVKLNIKDNFLKLRSSSHIDQLHLKYLAKAITLYHDKLPEYSIMEAFKIIEQNKHFSEYCKYYSLRNIIAHSPKAENQPYIEKTLRSFDIYFNHDYFDYIKYELEDNKLNSLLLDFESDKTHRKLMEVSLELIEKLKQQYLQI